MLVLSRKQGQSIVINRNVTVYVDAIHGDKVLLSIDAPKEISVNRDEVQRAIDRQGRRGKP